MPQLKLGWIAMNGPEADRHAARERLEVLCDTYLSVSTPVQNALVSLLSAGEIFQRTIQERIEANLKCLDQLLAGSAATRLHLDGGWSAIIRLPSIDHGCDQPSKLLDEEEVIVQPGYLFDLPDSHCVISLLTDPEIFEQGVGALCRFTERQVTRE